MLENFDKLEKHINSELTSKVQNSIIENGELLIEIDDKDLIEVVQFLKSDENLRFRQLIDITAVDYPERDKRFKMVYLLLSHEKNSRIIIEFDIRENEIVPSLTSIFPSANWMEREVFDMYGVKLRIILI